MKLSRITSKFNTNTNKYDIFLYGYNSNGEFITKKDTFNDYFYISENKVQFLLNEYKRLKAVPNSKCKSIYGEDIVKIMIGAPWTRKKIEKSYKYDIFMCDVKIEIKYLIENPYEWDNNRNICFYDIETWYDKNDPSTNTPSKAQMPITSITCYISKEQKYYILTWHPEITKDVEDFKVIEEEDKKLILCKDEMTMIRGFISMIKLKNVDVMTGWFSDWYDLPYIVNRCKVLKTKIWEQLSPINYSYNYGSRIYINGLDTIDYQEIVIEGLGYRLSNNKLATASKEILGDKSLEKLHEESWKDWLDNYNDFLKYAIRDVEILKEIDDRIQGIPLYVKQQQIAFAPSLNYCVSRSHLLDSKLINTYNEKYKFPFKDYGKKVTYEAAIVLHPKEPGLHHDVIIADYLSLYPTIIMAFNISPETFIASHTQALKAGTSIDDIIKILKEENVSYVDTGYSDHLVGKRYLYFSQNNQQGIIPETLRGWFKERLETKKQMKECVRKSKTYEALDKKQYALKILLNASYGATAFPGFRLHKFECSDTITYFSRKALMFAINKFEEYGFKVLYGDTDSIFIKIENINDDEINNYINKINKDILNELVLKYNPDLPINEYMFLELEYEKRLSTIYFSNSKKRYYGIDAKTSEPYIRGLNIIRIDTPEALKPLLNKLSNDAVLEKITLNDLISLRKKVETIKYEKLGIVKNFTKKFSNYKKTQPQHIVASKWANEKLKCNINHNDNPYLFYIVDKVDGVQNAICLNFEDLHLINERKDIFEIDYDIYFDKQVLSQLEEFDFIPLVKKIIHEYRVKCSEFYSSYFKRYERIKKKLKMGDKLSVGYIKWLDRYKVNFDDLEEMK